MAHNFTYSLMIANTLVAIASVVSDGWKRIRVDRTNSQPGTILICSPIQIRSQRSQFIAKPSWLNPDHCPRLCSKVLYCPITTQKKTVAKILRFTSSTELVSASRKKKTVAKYFASPAAQSLSERQGNPMRSHVRWPIEQTEFHLNAVSTDEGVEREKSNSSVPIMENWPMECNARRDHSSTPCLRKAHTATYWKRVFPGGGRFHILRRGQSMQPAVINGFLLIAVAVIVLLAVILAAAQVARPYAIKMWRRLLNKDETYYEEFV